MFGGLWAWFQLFLGCAEVFVLSADHRIVLEHFLRLKTVALRVTFSTVTSLKHSQLGYRRAREVLPHQRPLALTLTAQRTVSAEISGPTTTLVLNTITMQSALFTRRHCPKHWNELTRDLPWVTLHKWSHPPKKIMRQAKSKALNTTNHPPRKSTPTCPSNFSTQTFMEHVRRIPPAINVDHIASRSSSSEMACQLAQAAHTANSNVFECRTTC